jgi:8-oxo-dGTP diphosphatase
LRRLYPNHPVVGVGAVVLSEGRLLLEKRKNDPGKHKWSIPGGVVEVGESTEQAVVREVEEETGLQVTCTRLIDVANSISLDEKGSVKYHFVIVDYLVSVTSGVLNASSDADELKWVPLNEVESYDLTLTFRSFFKKNKKNLETESLK